jgi:hypothetical protein
MQRWMKVFCCCVAARVNQHPPWMDGVWTWHILSLASCTPAYLPIAEEGSESVPVWAGVLKLGFIRLDGIKMESSMDEIYRLCCFQQWSQGNQIDANIWITGIKKLIKKNPSIEIKFHRQQNFIFLAIFCHLAKNIQKIIFCQIFPLFKFPDKQKEITMFLHKQVASI